MGELILIITQLYSFIILGRVLMSWVQVDPYSPLARTMYQLTEPVLAPLRNMMGGAMAGLDFSPIIAMIGIQIIGNIIAQAFISAGL
jgi:YggT family protein